jgi:hypothetical protein
MRLGDKNIREIMLSFGNKFVLLLVGLRYYGKKMN